MHHQRVVGCFAGIVLMGAGMLTAQTVFDTASVRISQRASGPGSVAFLPSGQWSARDASLRMLLRSAYNLDRFIGMPRWADSTRFDIVTAGSRDTAPEQLRTMAQGLLAERFGLRAHVEDDEESIYALVQADPSQPLGPGLRRSTTRCVRGRRATGVPSDTPRPEHCAESMTPLAGGTLRVRLRDRVLNDFLILASARLEFGERVIDRTGLLDRFDIDVEFAPRDGGHLPDGIGLPFGVAIERQLGLRVEQRRERVDVLVIDQVSLPTPN